MAKRESYHERLRREGPCHCVEFPDFELDVPLPPGQWTDTSWHNDTMPSWVNRDLGVRLWIDYADPDLRESNGPRFMLQVLDEHEQQVSDDSYDQRYNILSDSYQEILDALAGGWPHGVGGGNQALNGYICGTRR